MLKLIQVLLLLLLVGPSHGFTPSIVTVSSRKSKLSGYSTLLERTPRRKVKLYGKRKRIQQVYQSIRNRFRRKRREDAASNDDESPKVDTQQGTTSVEERRALASALQTESMEDYSITMTEEAENVISGATLATVPASEPVDVAEQMLPFMGNKENGETHYPPGKLEKLKYGIMVQINGFKDEQAPSNGKKLANGGTAPKQEQQMEMEMPANNTLAATLDPLSMSGFEEIETLKSLYTLPPLDRNNLTKLETEFRDMLEYFCRFTEADLYTIRDPRIRAIMEGVVSGSNEAPVYRAFEVLFEDLPPIRMAGRIIYSKLKDLMLKAQARAQREVDAIVDDTGLSEERVQVSRLAFLTLAIPTEKGHEKEAYLTLDQLVECGLAEKAMDSLGYDDQTSFFLNLDSNQDGKVTFPELMAGLQTTAEDSCSVDRHCDPAAVLQSVVQEMEPTFGHTDIKQLDNRRQKFSDQYDTMVVAFQEWDDIVPEGEGRRLDILRGCFVGAANPRVVEALRVVYLDYGALRLAGNSIFAIMKTLVGTIRARKANNKK